MAYAPYGAGGVIVRVEADIRRGIPGIDITGLAEGAVREARERVRAAFRNSDFRFPLERVLINLAPAGLRKDGAALDLPIALSVMAAAGFAPVSSAVLVMGELELSGRIRPVRGVLAAVAAGLEAGITEFIVPAENAAEAAILGGEARCAAAATLREAVDALFVRAESGLLPLMGGGAVGLAGADAAEGGAGASAGAFAGAPADASAPGDFADVRGQPVYKRALEVAAAGGHNMLVFGPPGAGKTMLARRLPSIMAPLAPDEAVEVTRLYSLAGPFKSGGGGGFIDRLITRPPFRAPHHSASAEGILGGGRTPRPGEISLAHFGVLFLDEAPEYRANVLQALREPLEDRVISIVRAEGLVHLPADFQLLLAANACPCGRLGMRPSAGFCAAGGDGYGDGCADGGGEDEPLPAAGAAQGCLCSHEEISRYWRKFGGALLDRVELRVAVLPPEISEIGKSPRNCPGYGGEEPSAAIAQRVLAAVEAQRQRYAGMGIRRNALLPAGQIAAFCPLSGRAETAFHKALARLGLSGRAYHGILRVARTIADLEGADTIDTVHILEAVQHRRLGEDPFEIVTVGKG